MTLPELCLQRPVATITCVVAALVLGVVSLLRLPLEYLPEIEGRSLSITCSYPGSSPREVERVIVRPLEEELASLEGLESINSTAQASSATVRVELGAGVDIDRAAIEVRERIDRARSVLPGDVGRIEVRRWRSTDRPVLRFRVVPPKGTSRAALQRFVDEALVPRLTRLPGVGNVEVRGLARRRVLVELISERLAQAGLTSNDVAQLLRMRNRNASAGELRTGGRVLSVRVLGELGDAATVARLPLTDGRLVADVARVREETEPLDEVTRLDGREAITVRVARESGANSVEVCRAVKAELALLLATPAADGYEAPIFSDDAQRILDRLANLELSGLYGGVLLFGVLLLFLRQLRSTFVVAVTIPISIVLTFGILFVIRQAGVAISLNVVSMMGLILGVGLVVDNGIVVLENIFRLHEAGADPDVAAAQGAAEVARAITAAMVTSLIVFIPLMLTNSRSGRWMRDLALVVCAAVFSSLWAALTVVPLLARRLLGPRRQDRPAGPGLGPRLYGRLLERTLRWRWAVLLLVLPLCGAQIVAFFGSVERSWGGGESSREVGVRITVPRAHTEGERRGLFDRLEGVILAHREELDLERLTSNFATRAEAEPQGRGHRRGGGADRMELLLRDAGPGPRRSVGEVRNRLRELIPEVPGVVVQLEASHRMGGGGRAVTFNVLGRDSKALDQPAQALAARLREVPGVEEVELGEEMGALGVEVRPRRSRTAAYRVRPAAVGRAISSALGERAVTRLRGTTRELEVVVRLVTDSEAGVAELGRATVARGAEAPMPVQSLADVVRVPAPRQIQRSDREAVVSLTASVAEGEEVRSVTVRAEQALAGVTLPRGVRYSLGQELRRWRRGEGQSAQAVLLAFVLVLMVLSALFESYVDAAVIAVTVPFALVGVAWAFWATHTSLDDVAWIGLMILVGIVVNHGIVLVDRVRRLLDEGCDRNEAVVRAGRDRLRPIVMTAATTVLGLFPVVGQHLWPDLFKGDSGAQVYGPIGLAVVSGLTASTALTLLVLPALLSVSLDARAWLAGERRAGAEEGTS